MLLTAGGEGKSWKLEFRIKIGLRENSTVGLLKWRRVQDVGDKSPRGEIVYP